MRMSETETVTRSFPEADDENGDEAFSDSGSEAVRERGAAEGTFLRRDIKVTKAGKRRPHISVVILSKKEILNTGSETGSRDGLIYCSSDSFYALLAAFSSSDSF